MNKLLDPPGLAVIDAIPDPDTVKRLISESVRRTDLLRGLLRLSRRKANYNATHGENREKAQDVG